MIATVSSSFVGIFALQPLSIFTGKVQPEVQSVQISSTEIKETLRLKLTDLTTRTATKEVQVVEMTYDDADGVWQLSMMGARTGKHNFQKYFV